MVTSSIPEGAITPAHVIVAGVGNIGSHLLGHLARMPAVLRVTLIDPDRAEQHNLRSQVLTPRDLGRSKVRVQATRLRALNPALEVVTLAEPIEAVALGELRASLIACCLDNRRGRQRVNEIAWRLGIPWVDAAVDGERSLARVCAYAPGPTAPCLECAWGEADYARLEQRQPCQAAVSTAPTNAPAELGGLAAAMQALEVAKLLSGRGDSALLARQVLIDAQHHQHHVTRFDRNPQCRFDHEIWDAIEILASDPGELKLADLFEVGQCGDVTAVLSVYGRAFVRRLGCSACGWRGRRGLRLSERPRSRRDRCRRCAGPVAAVSFETDYELAPYNVSEASLRRPLSGLGFRRGEVVAITGESGRRHFQIGACT